MAPEPVGAFQTTPSPDSPTAPGLWSASDPQPLFTFVGSGGLAYDSNPSAAVNTNCNATSYGGTFVLSGIPSGATVEKAYLWITTWGCAPSGPIWVTFNGNLLGPLPVSAAESCGGLWLTSWAVDVTPYVAGDGSYSYSTTTKPNRYGDFLAAVYSSPTSPVRRIQINGGAASIGNCRSVASSAFAEGSEGAGTLVVFTQADDPGASDEAVYFNDQLIASGGLFQANDGWACSTVEFPVQVEAGENTVRVEPGPDWMGWHVAILDSPAKLCTAGFLPTQILRVPTDYATIQMAVNAATSHELILISPDDPLNPYIENVVISGKTNLTIKACKPDTVNITSASSAEPIFEAIQAHGLVIENLNFYGGSALSGSAISATELNGLSVQDCGFTGNSALLYGGAVSVTDCEAVEVEDSRFDNNSAGAGGGAISFLRPGLETTIRRSRFTFNSTEGDGGAIYVADGIDVAGGGGLRLAGGRPAAAYSISDNSAANGLGGGIYVNDSWAVIGDPVFVPDPSAGGEQFDLVFERNSALMGGGIGAQGWVGGTAWELHDDGPLVMCPGPPSIPTTSGYVSVNWAMLGENEALWGGGGIAAADATGIAGLCNTPGWAQRPTGIRLDVSNSYIYRNTVAGVKCTPIGDTRGGGIYYSGGESYGSTITSTLFHLNRSLDAGPGENGDGGGLTLNNYAQACVVDSTFTGNEAGDDGGGLDLATFSRASVVGGAMAGNISWKNGGGLHATCSSRAHVVDTVFDSNVAKLGAGGGLFVREAELTILGSGRVVNNKASAGGGGLMFWGDNLGVDGSLCITRGIERLVVDAVYEFRFNEAGVGLCPGCAGKGGAILVEREAWLGLPYFLPDLSMHLERFVAWDNVADTRVDRTDLRDGTGPFGDGVVIAGLENPQRQPSEPPWQGAKIAHSTHLGQTIRTEPTSSLGLFANFEGATTGLSVSGGHFQDGDRALYAHSSEFLVDTVSGLVQFFGNSIGIHADSCVSGLGEPAAATVDGADFEGHGLAATRWDSSNFSLRNSSFANDVSAVDIFGLLREGELVRNDLQAGVASQSGINITLGNPAGPPPSPLPALTVKQNDFQGYQPAPGRLAIRLVSPVAPPCGSGSMYLDVTDNWWGCPDWASLPFWGGPVTTCGIPFSPPCADISVIPPGVQFFDWSHSPNVP